MRLTFLLFFIILFGFAVSLPFPTEAATLSIAPSTVEIGGGEKGAIDLKIDSEGVGMNAAQAVVRFPTDALEVTSVDKIGSAFSFWLEEPTFSNTEGVISFIGGTPYGVSGSSIQVLKIEFRAKGSGSGTLSLSDAAISASDGSGTNILSKTVDAAFSIIVKNEISPFLTPSLPPPAQIVRAPVPTGKLPVKPVVAVPLYPLESQWYNLISPFTVKWEAPADVIGISTMLNTQLNYIPFQKSEGLFENKTYSALSDGVQYLHARFQNDLGWGPTAHYRLAVDTAPPLGFEITMVEGEATDHPAPTLQFKTADALSGLKEYQMRIGDGDLIKIPASEFNGTFHLPLQAPGTRRITVKAVDQADNGIEDSVILEIIPIASPTITFVTKELFSDEEKGLTVKGASLSNTDTLLRLYRKEALVAEGAARPDDNGNWEFTFDKPLSNGRYKIIAQSRNARGAVSLAIESVEVRVKSKPIIQIGFLQLGKGGAAFVLLLLLVAGFAGGILFYKKRQEKLALRVRLAEGEVAKIFKLIMQDAEQLSKASQTATSADDEYASARLRENIHKMEAYLQKGLEKIKR